MEEKMTFNTENDINIKITKQDGGVLFDENCCTCINIILTNDGKIATSFLGCHNPYIVMQLEKAQKLYFKELKKALKRDFKEYGILPEDGECDCKHEHCDCGCDDQCDCGDDCHCDDDCDCGCHDEKHCDCGCGDEKCDCGDNCECDEDCNCGCGCGDKKVGCGKEGCTCTPENHCGCLDGKECKCTGEDNCGCKDKSKNSKKNKK